MDIDHMKQHRNSKTNNKEETIAFSQSIGARMSAMEHLVPEQMFSTETEKAQGISAVKALAIASQQGQKIWTITNDNLDLALNRINLGVDAENDIRNAVNAGKIAAAHETRINFNSWIGEGYTLIDPHSGAGAYMISGGGNGDETRLPENDPSGINIISSVVPAVTIAKAPGTNLAESATFFGVMQCKLTEVAVTIAVCIALIVIANFHRQLILAAIKIAELGIDAGLLIKGAIIAALSTAGVANAAEVYERDCECVSGIRNKGSCWICSAASHPIIRGRVKNAKVSVEGIGNCHRALTKAQILLRIDLYSELANARDDENVCWNPKDQEHIDKAIEAREIAAFCASLIP